eukprot:gene37145-45087_t
MPGTKITFGLIRQKNPIIADAEDIQQIDSLDLSDCGIVEIANLELFEHIRELNLSRNEIRVVENLSILRSLQLLDLSFNRISSKDLLLCTQGLPKTLKAINLSGNPCIEDHEVLAQFQDFFKDLDIILDVEDVPPVDEQDGEEKESAGEDLTTKNSLKLNAEEILQDIVDRKCRLQNFETSFDLDSTLKSLNAELDSALLINRNNRNNKEFREKLQHQHDSEERYTKGNQEKIQSLLSRNENNKATYDQFLQKMKLTAVKALEAIHLDNSLPSEPSK